MSGAEPAPAKVNLYLHVTGRRVDGYHLLDSLAVFGPAADAVAAAPGEALCLTLDGPFAAGLAAEPDNLVLRAARALAEAVGRPAAAALTLTKRLPVASGIGGGSADAAAALRALDRLWGTGLGEGGLAGIAAGLGADVPVCLAARPARMQGIGEVLLPAPALPEYGLLLVNPGVALATPAVFRARQGGFTPMAELPAAWPDAAAMARDLAALRNDLEPPAIALCPVIAEVLAAIRALPGCLLARMSGSGATCFGLFPDAEAARRAAALLPGGWWREGGAPHPVPAD
ncbi:4-(cytidine 5'-diphospho)-2-C-methyl-D-erythritol kinase [Siccirubricoccus sp. KC 17139]|uniref:4-diphosphocytidyl-2-C-methyl-D-erythritol kinase n=1 Tax=Siccirubricoccus soli TaxID=2899147 RepID=A0ABT1DD31_9PROT|nr:4-(cytidine 5'-diphospho)-2-C-methyl-D-erythritol kinase [Siccirubricoccus soli]MCO6419842.1 4-(cytidine 5'-diphospho)-2-C-methyl-D-erythritol kinase [Siccirubricoccus soli]MCP2685977.1 4-(cytidine 5'-diphospho)-2-C-methyl-D-erythritol kinase [Siccirubricoccus soli]